MQGHLSRDLTPDLLVLLTDPTRGFDRETSRDLVTMARRIDNEAIDRRDFELYRPRGLPRFTILP